MVAVVNPASLTDVTLGPTLVSPPGQEVVDLGYATQAVKKGDPVMITGPAPNRKYTNSLGNATGTDAVGICLKTVQAGGTLEYATQGEFDGYVGMTAGARLSIVAGKLDTTAPSAGVSGTAGTSVGTGLSYLIRAVSPTRVRFLFV